jgi:hypothetical protein
MTSLFARSSALVALAISAVLLPLSLEAQMDAAVNSDSGVVRATEVTLPSRATNTDSLSAPGPRVVRAGVTIPVTVRSGFALPQDSEAQVGAGANVAMMGVGLAAIVVGSLVGGDGGTIIAIGGGVIGLFGLYRYLR